MKVKSKVFTLSFVIAVVLAGCVQTQLQSPKTEPATKIKVFLLAGQSNMDGRGDGRKLSAEDELRLLKAQKTVQLAYNRNTIRPLYVAESTSVTRRRFNLEHVFGPELFFGIAMSEAFPEDDFLFIKRSKGGTSLYGAWNPDWSAENAQAMRELDDPRLYQDMIAYKEDVLNAFDESQYEFCGILWVQGESDTGTKMYGTAPADAYRENLGNLIRSFRRDTEQPELPFIIMQVGGGKVVEAMRSVDAEIKNVSLIPQSWKPNSNDYYPKYGPPIGHYTYEGMKKIGLNFATTYLENYSCGGT